jgi:hypothetical protein
VVANLKYLLPLRAASPNKKRQRLRGKMDESIPWLNYSGEKRKELNLSVPTRNYRKGYIKKN